jgi:predicted dehydrogenase
LRIQVELAATLLLAQGVRYAIIRKALLAGKHVLIERRPSLTVSKLDDLVRLA